jgi:hypothetical protein
MVSSAWVCDKVGLGTSAVVSGTVGWVVDERRIEDGGSRCCSVYCVAQRMQREEGYIACEGKAGMRVVKCRNDSSVCQRKEFWMQRSRGMVPVKVGRLGLQWCYVSQQQQLSAGMDRRTAGCGGIRAYQCRVRRKVDRGPWECSHGWGERGIELAIRVRGRDGSYELVELSMIVAKLTDRLFLVVGAGHPGPCSDKPPTQPPSAGLAHMYACYA